MELLGTVNKVLIVLPKHVTPCSGKLLTILATISLLGFTSDLDVSKLPSLTVIMVHYTTIKNATITFINNNNLHEVSSICKKS